MAYDKKEMEELALKAIKEHNLITNEEIAAFLPCSERTFYNLQMQELQTIKKALYDNRMKLKPKLRSKMMESNNSALLLALYKLVANEDEFNRIAVNKNEHTGKDGAPLDIKIQVLGNDAPITDEPDYDDD